MNKKVALSLLSATVISSMAASAFAAPNSGIYMGGSVDRYYALSDLMNLNTQGLAKFNSDLVEAGSKNIVFVDFDKKGAFLEEIFKSDEGLEKVKRDLKQSDFEGVYTQVKTDGTDGATYDPRKDIDSEPAGELKVESVSVINAKQIQVVFGTAVDEDTVLDTDGSLLSGVFSTNGNNLTGTGEFSADGKTLTITVATTTEGTYLFSVAKEKVKAANGEFIAAYDEKVSFEDTVAPTLVNVENVNASTVKVNFSEPIDDKGSVTAKLADGTDLSTLVDSNVDGNSIVLDLSDAGIPASKAITVSFVGATDFSGNLVSPNPVTVTVQKGVKDGVAPTVSSITPVNAKKFEIKFSEEVEGLTVGDISINGTQLVDTTTATLAQDKTDKTKYVVSLVNPQQGLVTIALADKAVTDLSGEESAVYSKIVNFPADAVKPTLSNATVSKNKDGKEVLTLTFSEDVTLKATGTVTADATKVKDYVTSDVTLSFDAADLTPVAGTSNQYSILLSDISETGTPAVALAAGASYTVTLPASLVKDTANNENVEAASAFTFTRGSDSDTVKPGVVANYDGDEADPHVDNNGIKVVDNNTLELKFDKDVDGATATNKANYQVSGATVEKATLLADNVVVLSLAKDSNTYSGLRTVKVTGVKSKAGVTMDEFSTKENLIENVRPTVTSVAVTEIDQGDATATPAVPAKTVVTLTFSEAVAVGDTNDADFDLYIKGEKVDGVTITTASGGTGKEKQVVVTIADKALTATDFANGVTLVAQDEADIADNSGNGANIPATGVQVNL